MQIFLLIWTLNGSALSLIPAARRRRITLLPAMPYFLHCRQSDGGTPVLQYRKKRYRRWEVAGKGGDNVSEKQCFSCCPKKCNTLLAMKYK